MRPRGGECHCTTNLLSWQRIELAVLEGVELRAGGTVAMRQPGRVLRSYGPAAPPLVSVLALEAPAAVLTDGHSSRVPPTTID